MEAAQLKLNLNKTEIKLKENSKNNVLFQGRTLDIKH